MGYPILAGSIVEIQILGRIDGQRTRNVRHYWLRNVTAPIVNGLACLDDLADQYKTKVLVPLRGFLSAAWSLEYLQLQAVHPTRYRPNFKEPLDLGLAAPGSVAGVATPSGVAGRISLGCEESGHEFQGGQWYPGVPAASVTGSMLTVAAQGSLDAVGAGLLQVMNDTGGNTFYPILAHRLKKPLKGFAPPIDNDILSFALTRSEARYQRRREVGKGE